MKHNARRAALKAPANQFISIDDLPPGSRVVLCARVSSPSQKHHLPPQKTNLLKLAEERKWNIVAKVAGIEHGRRERRKGLLKLIRVARELNAVLVAESIDRFIRNPKAEDVCVRLEGTLAIENMYHKGFNPFHERDLRPATDYRGINQGASAEFIFPPMFSELIKHLEIHIAVGKQREARQPFKLTVSSSTSPPKEQNFIVVKKLNEQLVSITKCLGPQFQPIGSIDLSSQ